MRFLLALLLLSSCSHAPAESEYERVRATEIAGLNRHDVDTQLAEANAELTVVEDRLAITRARRDNLQGQASTDVNKQNAVEGAEAELATLQSRRGVLLHEQHLLEARSRELAN